MIFIIMDAVRWLFNILIALVFIRVVLSWLPMMRHGSIVSFVFAFTEPMLAPVRRLIDRSPLGGPGMMLDFSPIITLFVLWLLQSFFTNLLWSITTL